ncbi:nuclease-related domain-containing protein [Marinobacter nauticus]|uniref:nuclease-related domain-containing protein n=1 Tax=Marinobacter nauticus TaxID=2743 RepID=UPI001F26ED93|nr:nuclease-related domain-containing protein [Marinobacter nauticus]
MDVGQLFNTLLNSLPNQVWYFVPLFILLPILRTPWFKGKAGEAMVNLAAKLFLDKTRYQLIKNVALPIVEGATQIDHIAVLRYGVLLRESMRVKFEFHRRYSIVNNIEMECGGKQRFPSSGFLN